MKTLQIIACSVTFSLVSLLQAAPPPEPFLSGPTATPAASPELQGYIEEGKAAYAKGDISGAKSAFEMAYQMDSRNQVAIGYLRRINLELKSGPRAEPMEKQLGAVVIPQIQFHDATLSSAIEYLKNAVGRQTNGRLKVNIVVQLPAEQVNSQTVTLSLTNVPFTEGLRYLGSVANLEVVYDKYTVMLKPKAGYVAPTAPTATTTPGTTTPPTNTLPGAQ